MWDYVLILLAAAAVTYLLTPLARRLAIGVGAQHAARDRDVHTEPVPLLGGLAMYAGLAAALLLARPLLFRGAGNGAAWAQTTEGLLLAGGVIVVVGFVDDRWGISAMGKLAGQVAAAGVLVWRGVGISWLPLPGDAYLSLTYDEQIALTVFVVVATINAVNFIDGLDGLAAGITGISALAFLVYYVFLAGKLHLPPDETAPAVASAVLAGMCLGFLPHNFHPARIFMGDTGAMLIGLLLAYAPVSLLAQLDPELLVGSSSFAGGTVNRYGAFAPLLVTAGMLLIPYADLLMAVIRRTRVGMSPFAADKKHLQHRLLAIGHSHRGSVLIMYLWAALFSGSVVGLSIANTAFAVLVAVTIGAMFGLLLVSMPGLRDRLLPWKRASPLAGRHQADRAQDEPMRIAATAGAARPASGAGEAFYPAPVAEPAQPPHPENQPATDAGHRPEPDEPRLELGGGSAVPGWRQPEPEPGERWPEPEPTVGWPEPHGRWPEPNGWLPEPQGRRITPSDGLPEPGKLHSRLPAADVPGGWPLEPGFLQPEGGGLAADPEGPPWAPAPPPPGEEMPPTR